MCSLIVIIIVCNYNTISLGGERTTFPWTIFPGEILSINLGNVIRPLFLKNMDFPYGKFCPAKKRMNLKKITSNVESESAKGNALWLFGQCRHHH